MTVQKINEAYDKLRSEIYEKLEELIDLKDDSIIYELDQKAIDGGDYDYFIDVYNSHGEIREMCVEQIYKNGVIHGHVREIEEDWDINVSDIFNMTDKLTILNILSNE